MLVSKVARNLLNKYRLFKRYNWGSWWNYWHGFLPATLSVCQINRDNYKNFLNDVDYIKGHPYNGAFSGIIDNKLYLPMLFRNFKEYIPEYYFYKDVSGFLPLSDETIGLGGV